MILRDRHADTGWDEESDGVLEQRYYFCQNWRADVSAVVTSGGQMVQWVKYSAYGVPFGLPAGDTDSDGDCDGDDITQIDTWIAGGLYDVRGDLNLDGVVDSTDKSLAQNNHQGTTLGWNTLSTTATGLRHSYAGYQWDQALTGVFHVRNRVYVPEHGRWTRRDPLGYIDGMNLYEPFRSTPANRLDPAGLYTIAALGCNAKQVERPEDCEDFECSDRTQPGTVCQPNIKRVRGEWQIRCWCNDPCNRNNVVCGLNPNNAGECAVTFSCVVDDDCPDIHKRRSACRQFRNTNCCTCQPPATGAFAPIIPAL